MLDVNSGLVDICWRETGSACQDSQPGLMYLLLFQWPRPLPHPLTPLQSSKPWELRSNWEYICEAHVSLDKPPNLRNLTLIRDIFRLVRRRGAEAGYLHLLYYN